MTITNDQYVGLSKLDKWYRKMKHQIIDISGVVGTGTWDIVQTFLKKEEFDPREIMYLSFDQKQVLDLASRKMHAYYINRIIYKYTRFVDFDSLPINNPSSNEIKYEWKKEVRSKIDPIYRIMIVFDSVLMNERMLKDLASFGLPIILLRDPMVLPAPDTYTFLREPNIQLTELNPELIKNPIVYFAQKILHDEPLKYGNFDNVSVVPRKQMNLYNLKSSDMNLVMSDKLMDHVNNVYRSKILKRNNSVNIVGERLICMSDMYAHKLVNTTEKKIKVYLTKGTVGYLTKCNKHIPTTKYVPIEFRPEFYHESFDDLTLNRHYLNGIDLPTRQVIPDETVDMKYAYALTVPLARVGHWDKVTLLIDTDEEQDEELQKRLLYSAITKARRALTIIL